MSIATASQDPPAFDSNEVLQAYLRGDYDFFSERSLAVLNHFQGTTYYTLNASLLNYINRFVHTFLFIFTQPDFRVSDRHIHPFVHLNRTISNLVAISSAKTTDSYLDFLRDQHANFVKILTLYSARNSVKFDLKPM